MTQHTPGPWFIAGDEIHDRETKYDEHGARIGETANSICEMHPAPHGAGDANGRLIAAAPRLLETLRRFVDDATFRLSPDSTPGFLSRLAAGKAAIAAATGEEVNHVAP